MRDNVHYGFIQIPLSHISPFAIDEALLLYKPTPDDIVRKDNHSRVIFNNVAITQEEEEHVEKFINYLLSECSIVENMLENELLELIHLMQPELLRLLYSAKFDYEEAASLTLKNYEFRLSSLLPATINEIEKELKEGYLYWFGRDKKFRPTLIADIFKLQNISVDKILKLVIFCFEFFLRYLHVGGRAESYNVMIDCCNKSVVEVPIQMIIKLVDLMHSKYRGRLHKIYLINTPSLINMMMKTLSTVLPKGTFEKILILKKDFRDVLSKLYDHNQLQEKFGGTSSDLIEDFYPFKFFSNVGNEVKSGISPEVIVNLPPKILYGTSMILKKQRLVQKRHKFFESPDNMGTEEDSSSKYDLESWTKEIGIYMLTKDTAKYIINNRPQLGVMVEQNIIETRKDLKSFVCKVKI